MEQISQPGHELGGGVQVKHRPRKPVAGRRHLPRWACNHIEYTSMNTLTRLLQDFRTEFAANARLRLGVWVILAVVLFYLALIQSDRFTEAYDAYAAEAGRMARAETLLQREDWPQLLEAERAANQALEGAFWQADTQGLAQAQLQAALAGIANGLKLRDVRIQPGLIQPVPELSGVWRVQAQFSAGHDSGAQLQVLHALATHPQKLVIDRLDMMQGRARLVTIVSAYFVGLKAEPELE